MPPTRLSSPLLSQLPFSARALMSSLTPETRRSLHARSLTLRTSAGSYTNRHAVFTPTTSTQCQTCLDVIPPPSALGLCQSEFGMAPLSHQPT
ncbi:uncharacterized [Tachysurus ichikawai]